MRKLVTLREVEAVHPIKDADAIEQVSVGGWGVVAKKGEFKAGDKVIYIEIDSILPQGVKEFDFLTSKDSRAWPCEDGTTLEGHRLKTIRLRGCLSQGLVIPVPENWIIGDKITCPIGLLETMEFGLEDDLSIMFGVKKYEAVQGASLAGNARGSYPSWIPKTDQERIQNCIKILRSQRQWVMEEKLEGSSMTLYFDGEELGVTSRSIDLKLDQEGNTFVDVARQTGLLEFLKDRGVKMAIRGELIGPGIQGNIYKLNKPRFMIFDIWFQPPGEVTFRYMTPEERDQFQESIRDLPEFERSFGIVPYLGVLIVPEDLDLGDYETLKKYAEGILNMADGLSRVHDTAREGIVFKGIDLIDGQVQSFKAISNIYLLKQK